MPGYGRGNKVGRGIAAVAAPHPVVDQWVDYNPADPFGYGVDAFFWEDWAQFGDDAVLQAATPPSYGNYWDTTVDQSLSQFKLYAPGLGTGVGADSAPAWLPKIPGIRNHNVVRVHQTGKHLLFKDLTVAAGSISTNLVVTTDDPLGSVEGCRINILTGAGAPNPNYYTTYDAGTKTYSGLGTAWTSTPADGDTVRMDYPCQNTTISRALQFTKGGAHPAKDEIWVEFWAFFDAHWKTYWLTAYNAAVTGHCQIGAEQKFLFWTHKFPHDGPASSVHGRWDMDIGTFGGAFSLGNRSEYLYGPSHGTLPNVNFNGRWLRFRVHLRIADVDAVTGTAKYTLHWQQRDGTWAKYEVHNQGDLSERHDGFTGCQLAANMNRGPCQDQSWYWGPFYFFDTDPFSGALD